MRRILPVIGLLIAVLIATGSTAERGSLSSRARVAELKKKHAQKRKEVKQVRQKVRELKKKERAVTTQLEDSQQKIEKTAKDLRRVNRALHVTLASLNQTRKKLTQLKSRLHQHLDELADLVVAYYKNGRSGYAQVLLTSDSFNDFIRRKEMVRRIVQSDNDLIAIVESEQRVLKQREEELEKQKRESERLEAIVSQKKEEYEEARTEQSQVLSNIQHERAAYEQYLAELEQSSREIARLIRSLSAARKRRKIGGPTVEWKGGFIRPVGGDVRSPFGYRTHPIFKIRKLHTGVDLGASYGTPIRATADGVVIYSGWKRGYGKTVVLDHGGDLATLYAHCSELMVSLGQSVKQGQTIGRVGSTGYSTGPHLHFEVRRNGTPINPLSFR